MSIAPSSVERWEEGDTQPQTKFNILATSHNLWVSGEVLSRTTDTQPGSPAEGDAYIITATPSGADWAGFTENYVAQYLDGAWLEYAPIGAVRVYVTDEGVDVRWSGSTWSTPTAATDFDDSTFRVSDNGDSSKKIAFQASGITTSTVRTITMPDADVDLGDIATNTAASSANTTNIAAPIHTLHVETVANQDYVLTYDAPYAGTITTLRAKTESGTCTVTGYINGVALGGTACSAATTADEEAHASANAYSKGDEIKITVTSNSAATDLEVTFYGTRSDL